MKTSRYTETHIVKILKEVEAGLLANFYTDYSASLKDKSGHEWQCNKE